MEIRQLSDLFVSLRGKEIRRLVVVNAVDEHSLLAVYEAVKMQIVQAILTGNREDIIALCEKNGIDVGLFEIIHAENDQQAATIAVKAIHEGKADIVMKGLINSDKYMRALLNKEFGLLPPKGVLSHITVIENPNYHKLLIVSDVAVIPTPDLNQKAVLIQYLVDTAKALGIVQPKVALIAATEQVLPGMIACTDAAILSKMGERGAFGSALVDGPMGLDVAVDHESAEIKKIQSPVAGEADCLLFPNIESGNVFYKTNTKLCNSGQAAIVVGTKAPAVLSSRGDSIQTKLNSIALAAIMCK